MHMTANGGLRTRHRRLKLAYWERANECPLWVISGHSESSTVVTPNQRLVGESGMSAKGNERTSPEITSSAHPRCLMNLPASAAQAGKRSLRVDICHGGGCP